MRFFEKCKENLVDKKTGMVFVKENVHDDGFYVDKDDNSVVRSDLIFNEIFEKAGFTVVKHKY
jgi:protein N-terminal methyltransferase